MVCLQVARPPGKVLQPNNAPYERDQTQVLLILAWWVSTSPWNYLNKPHSPTGTREKEPHLLDTMHLPP